MTWWGKSLGLIAGFLAGGPAGALLGGALGFSADRGVSGRRRRALRWQPGVSARVMEGTFTLLGAVARADGVVTQKEVDWAEHLIAKMKLSRAQGVRLRTAFNAGRQANFSLPESIIRLRPLLARDRQLTEIVLQTLIRMARVDAPIHPRQARLIHRAGIALGVTYSWLAQHLGGARPQPDQEITDPYTVLGVSTHASNAEVKQRYRRLMQRYHPDRLGPEASVSAQAEAAERYAEVRRAWEHIRLAQGIR